MKHGEIMQLPAEMPDDLLYALAREYGAKARKWMRKFEGLLPEIVGRKIYKKHGFAGVYEFAKKLAGMSERKVDKILWLHGRLKDKPELRKQLEMGEQPWHKIEKVSGVATAETDKLWAQKVAIESRPVLELSVREEREKINRLKSTPGSTLDGKNTNSQLTGVDEEQMAEEKGVTKWHWLSAQVSPDVEFKLRKLKHQLEKERGEAVAFNEVFKALLEGATIREEKTHITICHECVQKRAEEKAQKREVTRYISREIKKLVLVRQRYRCAKPACVHPPAELHHIDGFAVNKNHNPDKLEYLCERHHKQKHAHDPYVLAALKTPA